MTLLRELTKEILPAIPSSMSPEEYQYHVDLHKYLDRIRNVFTTENVSNSVNTSSFSSSDSTLLYAGFDYDGSTPLDFRPTTEITGFNTGTEFYFHFMVSQAGTYKFGIIYAYGDYTEADTPAIVVDSLCPGAAGAADYTEELSTTLSMPAAIDDTWYGAESASFVIDDDDSLVRVELTGGTAPPGIGLYVVGVYLTRQ